MNDDPFIVGVEIMVRKLDKNDMKILNELLRMEYVKILLTDRALWKALRTLNLKVQS